MRAQLTDGYINWNRYAAANVRVGQFKTPFGFEQLYADPRLHHHRAHAGQRPADAQPPGRRPARRRPARQAPVLRAWATSTATAPTTTSTTTTSSTGSGRVVGDALAGRARGDPASWSVGGERLHRRGHRARALLGPRDRLDADDHRTSDGIFTGKRRGDGVDSQFVTARFELWGEYLNTRFEPANNIPKPQFKANGRLRAGVVLHRPQEASRSSPSRRPSIPTTRVKRRHQTDTTTLGLNYYIQGQRPEADGRLPARQGRRALDSQDKVHRPVAGRSSEAERSHR